MATPFNTVEDLCSFCAFREGPGGASDYGEALRQSVTDGTFAFSQLQSALTEAREEIFARAGQLDNDEYETARAYQLKQAELYLATSRLYERFAEKVSLKFPESNLASAGNISIKADTPSPLEKMEGWHRVANQYRAMGERLLTGQGSAWDVTIGTLSSDSPRFPCLSTGIYQPYCNGCCMECIE